MSWKERTILVSFFVEAQSLFKPLLNMEQPEEIKTHFTVFCGSSSQSMNLPLIKCPCATLHLSQCFFCHINKLCSRKNRSSWFAERHFRSATECRRIATQQYFLSRTRASLQHGYSLFHPLLCVSLCFKKHFYWPFFGRSSNKAMGEL